jgi:cytochrome c biogenesis protein CcmG/thiol:disulfide interchange protein DsbE
VTVTADDDRAAPAPPLPDDDPLPRRGRRSGLVAAVVAAVVLVAFVVLLVGARRPSDRSAAPGKPAPGLDRAFPTVAGDRQVKLGDLRGRYVVLNVFASWCDPCVVEHPELIRFQQEHAATGDATVVQVLFDDKPAAAKQFAADRGDGGWPVLVDPDGQLALDYGVTGPPETYLIDPEGIVLAAVKGGVDQPGLDQLLARAKAGR